MDTDDAAGERLAPETEYPSSLAQAIALPSHTHGGSRMRESRPYGSVRGARDETRVPTATVTAGVFLMSASHLDG